MGRDVNPSRLFLVLLLALTACTSNAPRLWLPYKVEANCESRSVKQTAIDAIIASTDDTLRTGTYPGDAPMRKLVHSGGGVFAYWRNQPLRLPNTAKALGLDGDYVTVKRAVITNQIDVSAHSRPVWLTIVTPHGERMILERAYDIQDVCIEGQRQA
jgi:hypothetical protein